MKAQFHLDQNNAVDTNWYHNSVCDKFIITDEAYNKCFILKAQFHLENLE